MKNYLKNSKAITLIALVITIVILIILTGVLINISLGNNGLFNKAKEAKEKYVNAQTYEDTEIAKISNEIDNKIKLGKKELTEINYLVTTGNQYIDTGFIPNQNTTVEMKYQLLSRKTQFLFGARKNQEEDTFCFLKYFYDFNDAENLRTDLGTEKSDIEFTFDGIHIVKKEKEKTYLDGVLKVTNTSTNFSAPVSLTLFNVNTNGNIDNSLNAKIKFFYCKIWDGDTLIRDFVPAIDSNGKTCVYDKLNKKVYYANYGANEEEFLKNTDLVEMSIITRGTQYVDTGIKPNNNTKVEMKCKINDAGTQFIFGSRTDETTNSFSCVFINNSLRFDYGTTQTTYSTYNVGNIYTISLDKGNFYINNTKLGEKNETFNVNYNLYLFATNTVETATLPSFTTLYYCKIWDGDTLKRDFVPTIDNNNQYCLYDKVTKTYFYGINSDFFLSLD